MVNVDDIKPLKPIWPVRPVDPPLRKDDERKPATKEKPDTGEDKDDDGSNIDEYAYAPAKRDRLCVWDGGLTVHAGVDIDSYRQQPMIGDLHRLLFVNRNLAQARWHGIRLMSHS